MKARKRNILISALIAILFSIGIASSVYSLSFSNGAYTFRRLMVSSPKVSVGWATQTISLTGNTARKIKTKLRYVESCVAHIEDYMTATPTANIVRCDVPDQSAAATRGEINLQAGIVGITATAGVRWSTSGAGTTKVTYQVYGYGTD